MPLLIVTKANRTQQREAGYALLALLLFLAVIAITATVVAPKIIFQIKRDREEELVHRGIQYRRAVRMYVTRTGRYPNTLEALLGTGDTRYIRKLYKDPITGGDFRLLHMGDVQPGVGISNPALSNQNGPGSASSSVVGVGNSSFRNGNFTNSGLGSNGFVNSGNAQAPSANSQDSPGTTTPESVNATDPSNPQTAPATGTAGTSTSASAQSDSSQPGLLIFGVASKSKDHTIREFNHKNHYSDWWFFYDPRANGYEFKGPTPPPGSPPIQNGVPPQLNSVGTQTGFAPPTTQSGAQPQPQQ
jgi:type II secretory pathway pseudopilin PulG